MTTLTEEWFFKELDSTARRQYRCFVAEMFLRADQSKYFVCFRPTKNNQGAADPYACRYLQIDLEDVEAAFKDKKLTSAITKNLEELETLS